MSARAGQCGKGDTDDRQTARNRLAADRTAHIGLRRADFEQSSQIEVAKIFGVVVTTACS